LENQRLIGFLLVLGGSGIITFVFIFAYPTQMETSKIYLLYLFSFTSNSQPYPDPLRETLMTIIYIATFQSFQQIENNAFFIYLGITLTIFGGVLMFFEGFSLEILEEEEEKLETTK